MKDGEFFSRQYLRPVETLRDSPRFRKRLEGYFFDRLAKSFGHEVSKLIQRELGIQVPFHSTGYDWVRFFEEAELRDILGAITATYRVLERSNVAGAKLWLEFCSRVLDEEALAYRIDPLGGVHYLVDSEFERSLASTLAGLESAKFAHARESLSRMTAALDRGPDTLGALRSCWDANENVFKIILGGKPARLTESELKKYDALIAGRYSEGALVVARQMKEAFGKWVTAMHQYRHAPHTSDPSPPPLDLTVLLISQGLGFLRWQAGLAAQ